MSKIKYSIFLIVLLSGNLFAQEIPKFRINPSTAYGGNVSDYFDAVDYIPLETTKESLFGEIDQLIVSDSSFIVLDFDTNCALFFDLKGKFIRKIKITNKYPTISEDKIAGTVLITSFDPVRRAMQTDSYSLNGYPITKTKPSGSYKGLTNLISIGHGFFASTQSCYFPPGFSPKDSIYNLVEIYNGTKLYKSFLPYNQQGNLCACAFNGTTGKLQGTVMRNGSFYISSPLDFYIYKVNKDTALKAFQLVFPSDRYVTADVNSISSMHSLDSLRDLRANDTKVIIGISNIFLNKNLLFFKVDPFSYTSYADIGAAQDQYNFIYDTISGRLVSLERITPDVRSFFLPILGTGVGSAMRGLIYNNGYLYSSLSSLQLFDASNSTKDKDPKYSPVLVDYFKNNTRKSNPVISRMKLKF